MNIVLVWQHAYKCYTLGYGLVLALVQNTHQTLAGLLLFANKESDNERYTDC